LPLGQLPLFGRVLLGFDRADSLSEAIAMAKSAVGPSPDITMMHHPPIVMADME